MEQIIKYQELMPLHVPPMIKTPEMIEIEEQLVIVEEKGMHGQVKTLKRRYEGIAFAVLAESKAMACLEVEIYLSGFVYINRILTNGERINLERFNHKPLSTFEGNIPSTVIRDIPPDVISRARVFSKSVDPIIALPIKPVYPNQHKPSLLSAFQTDIKPYQRCAWLWLGIYQWD